MRALLVLLLAVGCTPGVNVAPCRNDSDCPDADRGRAYCVRQRCVECITRASCGPHMTCTEGQCVSRYEDKKK